MDKFNQLIIQFNQSGLDPQFFESFFKELLASPLVISAIFLTVGLLMPLMEELLKPLGLWALRKRLLTPAEGFSGGLICGAGFALIESATMIAQNGGGSDWGQMVLLRIGTSLLHMTGLLAGVWPAHGFRKSTDAPYSPFWQQPGFMDYGIRWQSLLYCYRSSPVQEHKLLSCKSLQELEHSAWSGSWYSWEQH
jgi:hypothetical protein